MIIHDDMRVNLSQSISIAFFSLQTITLIIYIFFNNTLSVGEGIFFYIRIWY